jgi:hypothetical protein
MLQAQLAIERATRELQRLAVETDAASPPTARDWTGFFAALAAFAQALLPLIAPFLVAKPK